MPLDPQWDYRFPLRKQFPEDHYKYTRMLFEYFLDPSYDDWTVMVVEDVDPAGSEKLKIASISVDKRGGSTRRDANQEHFNAFCNGQAKAYKKYFGNIGPEQLHLQILATLPDFQRRGHATTLCRWGMDVIRRESLKDISVMASPMGYHLYARLGFDHVATVIIQVPGEEEKLTLQAMNLPTNDQTYHHHLEPFTPSLMDVIEQGLNYILNWIPPNLSFFVFSLALINAADVHSANIRGHLATAIETNTVLVENHDQGHDQGHPAPTISISSLKPFTATTTPATTITVTTSTSKPGSCSKLGTGTVPLPTGITATPTTLTAKTLPATTLSSIFLPEASCMLAIFSLIADIPTPGPALSTALDKAEDALVPSAVANPQCTITLPATLSSEYGVYTSRVNSWVSEHSKELNKLDSVCGETYSETGRMSAYNTGATAGPGCTAPVAVFTGATSTGTTGGGGSGSGSGTAKATGSSTGVVTSTKTGTGTVTVTTATVTSSVTSSITGSATTVAGATSSQPASGLQAGGAARVTGVMTAAMVVAGFLAVVVVVAM
ncbi:hypothetical protein B0H65DRAFT_435339 [Neurospora tetraspora]|uniref:N-acetyltransferase domain-containing protein n=1 Tax=Neurospora tetraspora TaxID=94610 RepID=A0AAE0J7F2_9PEZI|nr:hypothetical protein B0H65DRAFT_435339 [Neurospora tetraspora]